MSKSWCTLMLYSHAKQVNSECGTLQGEREKRGTVIDSWTQKCPCTTSTITNFEQTASGMNTGPWTDKLATNHPRYATAYAQNKQEFITKSIKIFTMNSTEIFKLKIWYLCIRLVICVLHWVPGPEDILGSECTATCVLDLSTRWRQVVSFMLWPLYLQQNKPQCQSGQVEMRTLYCPVRNQN